MKQDIKKLITSIIILSAAFILIDVLVGHIGEIALKKLPDFGDELCKTNYRLNRVKTDVIIVGSSRARHHYCTSVLADSINAYLGTNYSFYNAGINGQFVDCDACTVESILNRYKPNLIIFDTYANEFTTDKSQKRLSRYEPFCKTNTKVKDYLNRMGWKEKLKVQINMYRFNSKAFNIIGDLMCHYNPDDGYNPLYQIMKISDSKSKKKKSSPNKINDFSVDSFDKMLSSCSNMNIKIIVSSSPRYKPNGDNELIHSICDKYNIPYIELYNTVFFNSHPELFYDKNHLNNDGAILYTKMFFEALKPYLK